LELQYPLYALKAYAQNGDAAQNSSQFANKLSDADANCSDLTGGD
jgi:hypothetical protein